MGLGKMDAATAIKIAKEARKVARKVKELYELDQRKRIRVMRDIILGRFRNDIVFPDGSVRSVPDFWCDDFAIVDGVFEVFATGDRDPFCDGSSLAPDKIGSWNTIKAALGHDAGYEHLEEIAEAWGWTTEEVRWLFDAMFGNLLHAETESQKNAVMRVAGNAFEKIYYWAVRRFGGFYHSVKQAAPALLALLLVAGCLAIPDVFEPSDEQPEVAEAKPTAEVVAPAPATPVAPATPASADEVDFSALDWCWGGFSGKKAALADGVQIGSLKISSSGLSYKWVKGGCEKLGASSATDASCLACLFVRVGGKWQGGKVDWISTSRTTRSFENVRDGYNGWRKDAIEAADAYAFVICSSDGKRRSNVALFAK